MEHSFTPVIMKYLKQYFATPEEIFKNSELLQYLNKKTKSADRGSKSRSSYGNIYAVYVLVEDYLKNGFDSKSGYENYDGAKYSDLLSRQRELPFGSKLQNHALNHRMNEEFKKYFPDSNHLPILRDLKANRYWINEKLLIIDNNRKKYNISKVIIDIIDEYIKTKQDSFDSFIKHCQKLKIISKDTRGKAQEFILSLLAPNVDARIFEIISYAILKYFYHDQKVFLGFELDSIEEMNLILYKTGRTNANDGGIDFVMKPLGRFFQVTETTDLKKYFLDIDKIEKFPITFVIKSTLTEDELLEKIKLKAKEQYFVNTVIERYLNCIEEIINIPKLIEYFTQSIELGYLKSILNEIIIQSKVEFNYVEEIL